MAVELGIIEGYFGRPWGWEARRATMEFLAPTGYRFFLYAPKADVYLRRAWAQPHPPEEAARIAGFSRACAAAGVRFGMGLSPFELYLNFDAAARDVLARKLEDLARLGVRELAILFDDMRGDLPDLAERQAEIMTFVAANSDADRLIMCPSYYSDDPVLDRVFGRRPADYLEQLGALLDPAVQVFWTGEEVCAREISPGHLAEVGAKLRRRPMLWDNYPVNDGPRMSQHLHLRAFTGRPAVIARAISAHAINPALQPTLTCVPALTLAQSYGEGDLYRYGAALRDALVAVLGERLGMMVRDDLLALQDVGLDKLGTRAASLRARYAAEDHPAAAEIVAWLDGAYRTTDAEIQTQ